MAAQYVYSAVTADTRSPSEVERKLCLYGHEGWRLVSTIPCPHILDSAVLLIMEKEYPVEGVSVVEGGERG